MRFAGPDGALSGAVSRVLAVLGTDTGVGKTAVCAALGVALRQRGRSVGYLKPVSSGCASRGGALVSTDADRIRRALRIGVPVASLAPVRYRLPLAPWVASWAEGSRFSWRVVRAGLRRAARGADVLLVEGVGGALVPLTRRVTVADLCARLRLPVLVVGRAGLGTINHVRLTVEALRRRGVRVRGVVLNGARGTHPAERSNARAVVLLTGVPVVAVLPRVAGFWSDGRGPDALARRFSPRALRILGLR